MLSSRFSLRHILRVVLFVLFCVLVLTLPTASSQAATVPTVGQLSNLQSGSEPSQPPLQLQKEADDIADLVPDHLQTVSAALDSKSEAETAVLTPNGGAVFFHQQQILLVVDAETLNEDTRFSFRPLAKSGESKSSEIAAIPGGLLQFELTAVTVADGTPVKTFERPIHIAVTLQGEDSSYEPGQSWFLTMADTPVSSSWEAPSTHTHDKTGLFSLATEELAPVMMAGAESGGEDTPSPWRYNWNVPTVSSFSGAATYNYPIDVPPGRAGLTPNVNISYSSRSVDGLTFVDGMDQGPLGLGWSISNIEISRNGTELIRPFDHYVMKHSDQFSLA